MPKMPQTDHYVSIAFLMNNSLTPFTLPRAAPRLLGDRRIGCRGDNDGTTSLSNRHCREAARSRRVGRHARF